MTPKALNGLMLYVTDVANSVKLYSELGFEVLYQQSEVFGTVKLGDFLIQFQDKRNPTERGFLVEALAEPKGSGMFVFVQVKDIDRYYATIIERGVVPATKPRDWPSGNREFVVRDPDGYKLVFYEPHGTKTIKHEH